MSDSFEDINFFCKPVLSAKVQLPALFFEKVFFNHEIFDIRVADQASPRNLSCYFSRFFD